MAAPLCPPPSTPAHSPFFLARLPPAQPRSLALPCPTTPPKRPPPAASTPITYFILSASRILSLRAGSLILALFPPSLRSSCFI